MLYSRHLAEGKLTNAKMAEQSFGIQFTVAYVVKDTEECFVKKVIYIKEENVCEINIQIRKCGTGA